MAKINNLVQDWKELASRAIDYHEAANKLLPHNLFQNAIEQAHLSLELIMKAAIIKAGGTPPRSHDLVHIAETKIKGKKFLIKNIKTSRHIRNSFSAVFSAWSMHDRYRRLPQDPYDAEQLIESYEKVYVWIRTNFVD